MKKTLKSKDVNRLLDNYQVNLSKKDIVEYNTKNNTYYFNKKPTFFTLDDQVIPTLHYLQEHKCLKEVLVDQGAIKFVINGANIMRPGIVQIDATIANGEIIVISDENHHKPLAVGVALYSGQEMQEMDKGFVIKNIHYVGDEIWKDDN
jgi:PUA-domain protein